MEDLLKYNRVAKLARKAAASKAKKKTKHN